MNFFNPQLPAFGLYINGTSLKCMQLDRVGKRVNVRGYTHLPLPKNIMTNDEVVDIEAFATLIRHALAQPTYGRFSSNRVIVSVPETKSFVRVIQIPKLTEEAEIQSAILFEAEAYIPLPMEQVYFDWQIIGEVADKHKVLIIASPKQSVDKYIVTLEQAGLKIVAIEAESQSLVRALVGPNNLDTSLLVHIDSFKTTLVMIEQGVIEFSSSIPIAGNTLTEQIAQALGVSSQQAEAIKKDVGIANTIQYPNIKTILLPVLTNLSEEIKNVIKFHDEHSTQQVNAIMLSGGNAMLKNLHDYLSSEFKDVKNMRIIMANPWANIVGLHQPPLSAYDALNFTGAIGLAARDII